MHTRYSKIVYKGKTIKEWSQENNIVLSTIIWRLHHGWTTERAISEPPYNNDNKRVI